MRSSSRGILFFVLVLLSSCGDSPTGSREPTPGEIYLEEALDIMEARSIRRYEVDWEALRSQVRGSAGDIETPSDAHPAIRHALSLIRDGHSSFFSPDELGNGTGNEINEPPLIRVGQDLEGSDVRVGYIRVPPARGRNVEELATTYHQGIERVDGPSTCGWVVDLRNNTGGNMWPMIAGLGPILGEGVIGHFVDPDSVVETWTYENGASALDGRVYVQVDDPYVLQEAGPPVAILVNGLTASSAEATFIAFMGRPGTYSFGLPTHGLPTANRAFRLSDGALLLLTVSAMADRTGRAYSGSVDPDVITGGWPPTGDPETDGTYREAVEWLAEQARCMSAPLDVREGEGDAARGSE